MMDNEHNPVATRITLLQQEWMVQMDKAPRNCRIVRWVIHSEDLPLINGFYRLESSPYGKIHEIPVVMLTDFEDPATFAFHLSKDWLNEYEKEVGKYSGFSWADYDRLKDRLTNTNERTDGEFLLIELLKSFRSSLPKATDPLLLLTLFPRNVSDYADLSEWLFQLIPRLPDKTGISLTDYAGDEVYSDLIKVYANQSISLRLPSMNMAGAYHELISQGNPVDPDTQIRKLMLATSKAASQGKQAEVHRLGAAMEQVGESSGNAVLRAYTCLLYAGFLFGFKDRHIPALLDKGISISEAAILQNDPTALNILFPLYAYKGSYYYMLGKYEQAFHWFVKEADTAMEHNHPVVAITACKQTIILSERHSLKREASDFLSRFFDRLYVLEDEVLQYTEFFFVSAFYLSYLKDLPKARVSAVTSRMVRLFGTNWQERSRMKTDCFSTPQKMMEHAFSR